MLGGRCGRRLIRCRIEWVKIWSGTECINESSFVSAVYRIKLSLHLGQASFLLKTVAQFPKFEALRW
jgi:hypothetical protein